MAFRDKYIKEVEDKLSKWREGSEEYEFCVKDYRDYINTIDFAHDNGWKEGKAEGLEEGKALANVEFAQKMKGDGMPVELITKYTGLTIEEIEKL